jgi:hypothetical protein
MAAKDDSKSRLLDSLAERLNEQTSDLVIAVQKLHQAFDSFSYSEQMAKRNAMRVSRCLHEVWVEVSREFVRSI